MHLRQFRLVDGPAGAADVQVRDPAKVVVVLDHLVPANEPLSAAAHTTAREFVQRFGIKRFHDVGREQGISHVVVADNAYALPGTVMVNRHGVRFTNEGVAYNDMTKAFGAFDPVTIDWDTPLLERLGIPAAVLPNIVDSSGSIEIAPAKATKTLVVAIQAAATRGSHDPPSRIRIVPTSGARRQSHAPPVIRAAPRACRRRARDAAG